MLSRDSGASEPGGVWESREGVKFSPNHGNQVAIPGDYLPKTYEARSFRILPLENLLKLKNPSPSG